MNRNETHRQTVRAGLQLFALSFASLFLELMLIRWVPAVVRLVAYYANLMLISSFLGLGIGAMLAGRRWKSFNWFPYLLLIDVGFLWSCKGDRVLPMGSEAHFFQAVLKFQIVNGLILVGVFLLNVVLFIPLGQRIGQLFREQPPLRAYSWDLGGSLCGTLCFGAFSLLHFSAIIGFGIVSVIYIAIARGLFRIFAAVILAGAISITLLTTAPNAIWSPYYYITMAPQNDQQASVTDPVANLRTMINPPMYLVRVGRDFYQMHGTIDMRRYVPNTWDYANADWKRQQYFLPYQIAQGRDKVMVLGAGGGMDVEGALLNGAKHVDAVEIDPAIVQISRRFNAADVYADPRVTVHIDDARAALRRLGNGYDVVAFGFLDSQALFSSMSNLRLDGFIYTVESMRTAWEKLGPNGVLALSFSVPREWLPRKLIDMVKQGTGVEPICYYSQLAVVLIAPKGNHAPIPPAYGHWERVETAPANIALPTDNWPYLYLQKHNIPLDYSLVISALVVLSVVTVGSLRGWRVDRADGHFFFLGLGFLLLQTKSVTDCSLFFGTTWLVTTIVIAGILLMVLAANLTAMRLRAPSRWLYVPLLASLLLLYLVHREWVLGQSFGFRLAWSLLIVPLPIFFAGLIFSTTFREARDPSLAFGANLVGATIGGFCEYLGMAIGTHALALIVAGAYLASLLVRARKPTARPCA